MVAIEVNKCSKGVVSIGPVMRRECPESGGEEMVKTEAAMGGLHYERCGQSGRRIENESKRYKEF